MIRSDREIADRASQLTILDACDVCRIAVNGDDGFPYIVPLNFGVDVEDGQVYLYFHSANRGRKLDLIARDARVAFEADCDHNFIFYDSRMSCTMGYRSVMGQGTVEILPEERKRAGLEILMRHYHAEDFPWSDRLVPATTVYRLKVERMTGKFRDNVHPGETRWTPPAGWNGFDRL